MKKKFGKKCFVYQCDTAWNKENNPFKHGSKFMIIALNQ